MIASKAALLVSYQVRERRAASRMPDNVLSMSARRLVMDQRVAGELRRLLKIYPVLVAAETIRLGACKLLADLSLEVTLIAGPDSIGLLTLALVRIVMPRGKRVKDTVRLGQTAHRIQVNTMARGPG